MTTRDRSGNLRSFTATQGLNIQALRGYAMLATGELEKEQIDRVLKRLGEIDERYPSLVGEMFSAGSGVFFLEEE